MSDYSLEEEQLEDLKRWWAKHGKAVAIAMVIASTVVVSWRYYQHHKLVSLEQASLAYQGLLESMSEEDSQSASTKAQQLMKAYPRTVYALQSALILAQQAVDAKEFEKAEMHLKWVLEESKDSNIEALATQRLCRVYIETGAYEKAESYFKALNGDESFSVMELKGDIHFAKGERQEAKTAYLDALQKAKNKGVRLPYLELKLEDLGVFVHEAA